MILAEAISRLRVSEDWEVANRKAADFWKGYFDEILTVKEANFAFEAYHHYVIIEDFDSSIQLLFHDYSENNISEPFKYKERLREASWKLGLNHEIIYVVKYIIDKTVNLYYLSELWVTLALSYHYLGFLGNSISCHEKSEKLATELLNHSTPIDEDFYFCIVKELQILSPINISLCLIDMGEFQKASQNLEQCLLMMDELSISKTENIFIRYKRETDICYLKIYAILCFLKSLNRFKDKVYYLAKEAEIRLPLVSNISWTRGYSLFFLGLAYKNLGEIDKSFIMYSQAISYAKEAHNIQFKGKISIGLAELYQLQSDFEKALAHHDESIEILDKIGAKCDLAEAHYQRGLTHQLMGNSSNSLADFQEAIRLYEDMEAPKQVAKVQRAIENDYSNSRTSN